MQLSKIDARIMRNVTGMQQLELTLEPVSAFDYRSIILPLLKSFMRVCVKKFNFVSSASPFSGPSLRVFGFNLPFSGTLGGSG